MDVRQKHLGTSPTSAVCFLLQEEVLMCVAKLLPPKTLKPTSTSNLQVDVIQLQAKQTYLRVFPLIM